MITGVPYILATAGTPASNPGPFLVWSAALAGIITTVAAARLVLGARRIPLRVPTDRPLMFGPLDVVAVLVFSFIGGNSAMQLATQAMGLPTAGDGSFDDPDGAIALSMILLSQTLTQVPAALYFVLRMRASRIENGRRRGVPREMIWIAAQALAWGVIMVPCVVATSGFCIELGVLIGVPRPETGHSMLDTIRHAENGYVLAGLILSAVLFAPVLEEAIYRGVIQSSFASITGPWRGGAVIMASLLFTAAHLVVVPWQMLSGIFLLGIVLGWLYERTASLLTPILVHATFNGINLLVQFAVGTMG